MASRMNAQIVQQRNEQRRLQEAQVNSMKRYDAEYERMKIGAKQEVRAVQARRQNESARIVGEQIMQSRVEEQQRAQRQQARMAEQTQVLAQELEKQTSEQERREREIQRICNESEELRELESRLKLAYMNKERAEQHMQKQHLKAYEAQRNQAIEDKMEFDRQQALKREADEARAKMALAHQHRQALRSQISERERAVQQAAAEAEHDKALVDEVVAKIVAEDQKEAHDRWAARAATKKMIADYEVERREALEAQRRAAAEEEAKIRRYEEGKEAHQAELRAARDAEEAAKQALFEKLTAEQRAKAAEEAEMQAIRDLLWEEELELQRQQRDEQRLQRAQETKLEMMAVNEQMQRQKAERRALEAAEEERLVALMREKFAVDEAKEREEAARRAAAKQEHMARVAAQRRERAGLYQQEKEAELQELRAQEEAEAYRAQVVAEARRRLLEQHAAVLEGYAPKGVLQSADEINMVNAHAVPQQQPQRPW